MSQTPSRAWIGIALVCVGVFGAAFAVTGAFAALPPPAVGGTCGPGRGSEAAIEALIHPGSIGAGSEPAASNTTGRQAWVTFVDECQSAADDRGVTVLVIGVAAIGLVVLGLVLVFRSRRQSAPTAHSPPPVPTLPVW